MDTLCQTLGLEGSGVVSIVGAGGKTSLMFSLAHEISESGQAVLTTTTTKIMMPQKFQSPHTILIQTVADLIDEAKKRLTESLHISAASSRQVENHNKLIGFGAPFIDQIKKAGLFRWIIVEADGAARRLLKAPAAHEPVIPDSSDWVIGVVSIKAIGKPLDPEWVFRHELFGAISGLSLGMPVTAEAVIRAACHPAGIFKNSPPNARKVLFLNAAGNPDLFQKGKNLAQKMAQRLKKHAIDRIVMGSPLEKQLLSL